MSGPSPEGRPPRKTLLQLQGEVEVKDPSSHAKKQVAELDKTAKKSLAKRKACTDQIAADKKELALRRDEWNALVDEYIAQVKVLFAQQQWF